MTTSLNLRYVFSASHRILAFGLGSGLLKPAPGTWGSLAAWGLYALLLAKLSLLAQLGAIAAAFALGVWACGAASSELGEGDPGSIVWDEIVAVWLVLALIPSGFWAQLGGVLAFRFFDIVKPPPVRQADAHFKGGFGIMFDDIVAALYTLLCFALYLRLF